MAPKLITEIDLKDTCGFCMSSSLPHCPHNYYCTYTSSSPQDGYGELEDALFISEAQNE
jgi:hypothetical protein